jgi:hypothetical protein
MAKRTADPTRKVRKPFGTSLPPSAFRFLPFCLLPLVLACSVETKTKSEYCAEMPAAVCARLFDKGCAAIPDAPRYASEDECETAEKEACEARAADSRLSFDGEKAAACISQIEDQDCTRVARGDIHECDKVFTEGDAGVAPVTALDAGTSGDSGGDP